MLSGVDLRLFLGLRLRWCRPQSFDPSGLEELQARFVSKVLVNWSRSNVLVMSSLSIAALWSLWRWCPYPVKRKRSKSCPLKVVPSFAGLPCVDDGSQTQGCHYLSLSLCNIFSPPWCQPQFSERLSILIHVIVSPSAFVSFVACRKV